MASAKALREMFRSKFESEKVTFNPTDLARIEDDLYLEKFLKHNDGDLKASLDMLWDVLKWREENKVNDIGESNLNMDYIREGAFFPYGVDKEGSTVMYFLTKMHNKSKNIEELKQCIIYWFERIQRKDPNGKITLFFYTEGAGISNMDMEFVKFLITLIKSYYPSFLNVILAYEVPWILNAAFKVIKQLLPPKTAKKLIFVNKGNLSEFIVPVQSLKMCGGLSDYQFEFKSEVENAGQKDTGTKKVTFAVESSNTITVKPPDTISFTSVNGEFVGDFSITNSTGSDIGFKIRTTSPGKFRVKPSVSTIAKGCTQNVNIVAVHGVPYTDVMKEKFLILTVDIPSADVKTDDLNNLWKKKDVVISEYKLKCNVVGGVNDVKNITTEVPQTADHNTKVLNELRVEIFYLRARFDKLMMLNYIIIGVSVLILWFSTK